MTEEVKIGHSEVTSMPLGLGTNKVGGHNLFKGLHDEDGLAVVKEAISQGITMLDTAFMYGLGRSEELIGQAIHGIDRHQLVIATKAAQDPDQNLQLNNRPEFLTNAVDQALLRLNTDYIDIFYIHFPDQGTPKYEAVGALQRLKEAGKIRAIGVSNFSLAQIKEANEDGLVDIVEDNYSLVHQDAKSKLWPYLKAQGISFVPYFPLASGLLTGKYQPDQTFAKDDWQHRDPDFQGARYQAITKAIQQAAAIAKAHQATVSQVILAWYLQNPAIAVVIPGARKPEQVKQNAGALQVTLNAEELQQIASAFQNLPE